MPRHVEARDFTVVVKPPLELVQATKRVPSLSLAPLSTSRPAPCFSPSSLVLSVISKAAAGTFYSDLADIESRIHSDTRNDIWHGALTQKLSLAGL